MSLVLILSFFSRCHHQLQDELYRHFTHEVQANLHVVFTMNPNNDDFDNRSATSPALFNRCVIDWFGEWSAAALFQVNLAVALSGSLSVRQHLSL